MPGHAISYSHSDQRELLRRCSVIFELTLTMVCLPRGGLSCHPGGRGAAVMLIFVQPMGQERTDTSSAMGRMVAIKSVTMPRGGINKTNEDPVSG